ncbi:MAG: hypothetical protein FJ012_05135 [Chloroflexi bacterium]|nr:hypothetical protein [Chloroflexota bacterium]
MADRNDLRGPYELEVDLTTMSKEWLIKLLVIWHRQYASLNAGLFGALLKRMPIDEAKDVVVETFTPMYTDNMPLLTKLAGIKPRTFLDLLTVSRLSLDGNLTGKHGRFESTEEIISPNHLISTVAHCPYLEDLEKAGAPPEMMNAICVGVEEPLMQLVFQQNDLKMPKIKITRLRGGPRKSPGEPCCKWEFELIE